MPPKIRELKKRLHDAGFEMFSGKGSHQNWKHRAKNLSITIAGQDGSDAKPYQVKRVEEIIAEAEAKP